MVLEEDEKASDYSDDSIDNPPEAEEEGHDGWVKEEGGWVKLVPEENDEEETGTHNNV